MKAYDRWRARASAASRARHRLSDFAILEALLHKGPMLVTRSAGASSSERQHHTAIDRLEARGLVERSADAVIGASRRWP